MSIQNIREIFNLFASSIDGTLNDAGELHIPNPITDYDIAGYYMNTCGITPVTKYLKKIYTVMRHLFKYDIRTDFNAPKMPFTVRQEIILEARRLFRERFGDDIFHSHTHDCCRECHDAISAPLTVHF